MRTLCAVAGLVREESLAAARAGLLTGAVTKVGWTLEKKHRQQQLTAHMLGA